MSISAAQYLAMRAMLRGALSGNYPGTANPSEQEVLGFCAQLFSDSSGAAALSSAKGIAMGAAMRGVLSGNFASLANPNDADVITFWTQVNTDSSGATTLAAQRYLALRTVLRDVLSSNYPGAANPSDSDVLSYFGSFYNFATDPRVMARYRASDGLADISTAGILGPLIANGGAVVTGTDSDGNTVWQLRTGSGGYLKTTAGATTYNNPVTVVIVAKAGPAPASNQCWVTTFNAASSVFYASTVALKLTGSQSWNFPCVPASENVIMVYEHNNASSAAVNGAAFSAFLTPGINTGVLNTNLVVGAGDTVGNNRADLDVAEVLLYEGPLSAQFLANYVPYLRSRYPSRAVSATPPSPPSAWQTSRGALPAGAFDFIVLGGQSNNSNFAITGSPTAAGASAYALMADNTIIACPLLYDDATNAIDGIDTNVITGKVGGNGTALAAAYTAATGRNLVIVPCAVNGAALLANWGTALPRGNKQRNSLYGRMLDRTRNMIALGGTFRGLFWYQGETDAQAGGAVVASYQSDLNNFLTTFFTDLGIPEKTLIQTLANTVAGAGANLALVQAAQAANARTGTRVVLPASNGPYEGDNLHLQASAQNAIGVAAANAIVAAGW